MRALAAIRRKIKKADTDLMWHYRITWNDFQVILKRQDSKCAICRTERGNGRGHRLHVDHDHKTGFIRGLLCNRCNSTLGYMDEDPGRLRRAAEYLEESLKRRKAR